jgi:DNA (cytosine-5)-methyltransferase 1
MMIESSHPPFCQTDVSGSAFTHLGLFEGIGGFSLAARWMGWKTLAWCEWNEFGQRILKHHFPNAEGFGDITKTDFTKYANEIDILTGGFPCQPFSTAGKRKGTQDERYLWHEMLRAIQEIKPKYVIAENVYGITNIDGGLVFEQVCLDLEAKGYEVQPFIIPACAKNAPHRRDRVWFVAYNSNRRIKEMYQRSKHKNKTEFITKTKTHFRERNERSIESQWQNFPTQSPICGGDDGLPTELDGITFSKCRTESIKAFGNAIVPQVAYEIFKSLEGVDLHFR